jgi:hypothetical protein
VNAIQKYEPLPVATMQDVFAVGKILANSGLFGSINENAGVIIAATCHQQGISLMEYHRTYHTMSDGKPAMRADAMLAGFRQRGGKYKILENSLTRAAIQAEWEGETYTFEYTIEDGHRTKDALRWDSKAGKFVLKDNWEKRSDDMCWARCISKMTRRLCPEVNSGLYTPEEVSDFDDRTPRAKPVPLTQDEIIARAQMVTPEPEAYKPEPAAAKTETIDVEADWGVE